MDHAVTGANCCETSAIIDSFTYQVSEVVGPPGGCGCEDGTNPGCDGTVEGVDTFEFCDTYGGDCSQVIEVGSCVTVFCASCPTFFAYYEVTDVYCNTEAGAGICQYDAAFSCCEPG
jgi:hypothetical protein